MKKAIDVLLLLSLLVFLPRTKGKRYSPPERPSLIRCRSPEKETFTCWWEPGSDGGLPATYALYYRKENSETVYECPDYRTAGENSCFFDKNNTSIWVNYNITVVATNALGSASSDPVDVDVAYIVKPNPPERLAVTVMEDEGWPFLRVSWEPPHKADTRSGWITLIYEIRVKTEADHEWEMHLAGQQKMFNIFSLRSGGSYLVQVRCKPDHGFWSEWSSTSSVRVPDYFHREKSMWILITVCSGFIFLIFMLLLHVNSRSLKHCILPPVPGPKIKGLDNRLLKDGKSEEIFSALVASAFPPNAPSNYEDLEYLEVCVPKDQEPMLEETGGPRDGCPKSASSASDGDSGRGSCDSHTLLMDKCAEAEGGETPTGLGGRRTEAQGDPGEEETSTHAREKTVSPDVAGGRVEARPSVFSPLPRCPSGPLSPQSSPETAERHRLSDSLLPSGPASPYLTGPGRGAKDAPAPSYWEIRSAPEARGGVDVPPAPRAEDYSRVKGVDGDNVLLLLQREAAEAGGHAHGGEREHCYVPSAGAAARKPGAPLPSASLVQHQTGPGVSGYVDASTLRSLPTY